MVMMVVPIVMVVMMVMMIMVVMAVIVVIVVVVMMVIMGVLVRVPMPGVQIEPTCPGAERIAKFAVRDVGARRGGALPLDMMVVAFLRHADLGLEAEPDFRLSDTTCAGTPPK